MILNYNLGAFSKIKLKQTTIFLWILVLGLSSPSWSQQKKPVVTPTTKPTSSTSKTATKKATAQTNTCDITATVTDKSCFNLGTKSATDDKAIFTINVSTTAAENDYGGYFQILGLPDGTTNVSPGNPKVFDKQYLISQLPLNLTIKAANGACEVPLIVDGITACSPTDCIWDPLNVNPPYASSTIVRDCNGTPLDESDDTVSGVFTISGVPAGYSWDLDIKMNTDGTQKQFVSTQAPGVTTASWGPVSVATLKAGYPGQNGFVLWFMTTDIFDCLGDLFIAFPDCPVVTCTAPNPTGQGTAVCSGATANLTATGCTTGYTLKWYDDSGLTNEIGSGSPFTTPTITATTTYYAACVKDGDATCKSSTPASIVITKKDLPTLTAGTPSCASNGLTYSVTVTSNGTITADVGTVSGLTVSNIPAGTDVNITATLNGCTAETTVTSPNCSIPCNAPNPSGTGTSICPDNTATLTASGCTTGFTATWFSDATLNSQVGTGNSFTTPVLTATTDYYVSCVKNGDASCKSNGVIVTATVKPLPTLTAGTPSCASNGLTYSVTVTSNGMITADVGTVSGLTVSNIPAGTDVNITATLNGCTAETTVTSPTCSIPCNAPNPSGTGTSICPDNTATLTASGCTTGFTATWFSDATLNSQVGTGNSFTTPVLTATTDYYVSCIKNGDASCKSNGVVVTAMVKPKPTITITSTACNGTTVTANFTVTSGAVVTSNLGTVSGTQVTGIPSGQTFTLTATLNGCQATASDSKTCVANCDLNAVVDSIKCIAGTNTPILTDDAFTFKLTITGTGGASNLWEAVYNGNVIQTGAYGQTKVVTVGYATWNGATSMAIVVRDKDNTLCTDNVTVQVPNCSPAPCTGFQFTNIVANCENGLHKICLNVSGTGGRKWALSLKYSNDFTTPGIPFANGIGDQAGVCGTISTNDFTTLQAFDPDDFILWGMLELADGTPIFGTGCEIDSVVRYTTCSTCNAPTPSGQGTSICSATTATLSASGCTTGFTTTWFSDAGLATQLATGINFTTLALNATTDYYVSCVKVGDASCKSNGVVVTATVKPKPTITVTSTTCNQAGTSFDVAFTATAGAVVTADKGTVSGNSVTGVPSGQTVKLIVTLNGCRDSTTASKNCAAPCVKPNAGVDKKLDCMINNQQVTSTTLTGFTPTGGTWTAWSENPSPAMVNNIGNVSNMTLPGTYLFIYTVAGGCADTVAVSSPYCGCPDESPTAIAPNLTACIGDTFPTMTVFVTNLGTADWFTQPTGGTAVAINTLTYKPAGNVTQTISYWIAAKPAGGNTCDVSNLTRVEIRINAQNCADTVDLALKKSINKKIAQIGDILTYTIKVYNQSNKNATGVSVTDSIATTVQFVAGSFVASRGAATITGNVIKWTIGNIAAYGDTVTLTYQVKATQQGIHFNTAEICTTNEKDRDSDPCNHNDNEDDIDHQCFSVPIKLCTGNKVEASVSAKYTNVQWFKNGASTPIATGNIVLLSEVGTYTYTANNQTCPAGGCCPIIIEESTNCCVPQLCVPVTVKKIKN